MREYTAGNIIVDTAYFYDLTGKLVDPTTLAVNWNVLYSTVLSPTTTITYGGSPAPAVNTINRFSAGIYQVSLDTTSHPGYWWWQWNVSGPSLSGGPKWVQPVSAVVHLAQTGIPTPYRLFGDSLFGTGTFGGS